MDSIKSFINQDDPLSIEAIEFILAYKEEDSFVDYKESFDHSDNKQWIGITSDIMAFANTFGGYIVFGVSDKDFEIVGLDDTIVEVLTNTNLILQKTNRYVLPFFSELRTKKHITDKGTITIIFIPESKGKTHIYVKDVTHQFPDKKKRKLINAGSIFIRRSATNNVIDPEGLELIIDRRIDFFKESLLSKISKVIEAPPEDQILIYDPNSESGDGQTFRITNSPEATPIKGISFTVVPNTDAEEIYGWGSFAKKDPHFKPSVERLWEIYSKRETMEQNKDLIQIVVKFSLFFEIPVFYWLDFLSQDQIKTLLTSSFRNTKKLSVKSYILNISCFLGKSFFRTLWNKLGDFQGRVSITLNKYPKDPRNLFHFSLIEGRMSGGVDKSELRKQLIKELDNLISLTIKEKARLREKTEISALDCYLYSRKDKYIGTN